MSFTVDDFQDLLRLLDEHPEWQSELRRRLLTDDVLNLPAALSRVADRLEALAGRVEGLKADQARAGPNRSAFAAASGRTETSVEGFGREVVQMHFHNHAVAYLSPLAKGLRLLDPQSFVDLLDDAVDTGRMGPTDRDTVVLADLVLTGRRSEDDSEVFLLAEVSAEIGVRDVERAIRRSALLQKLGRPVVPVVAGSKVYGDAAELAEEHRVYVLLGGPGTQPVFL